MNNEREQLLHNFLLNYGVKVADVQLIDIALTHKSYANEKNKVSHAPNKNHYNQRLEFLGDAVLGLVVGHYFYLHYPSDGEGNLSKQKAQAVCQPTLAEIGKNIHLGSLLKMGKGESQTQGKMKNSNIADALEALIGAIFLLRGLDICGDFILTLWQPYLNKSKIALHSQDYKSILHTYIFKTFKSTPEYQVISMKGPEHAKQYTIILLIQGKRVSVGQGNNKKMAERSAAANYIKKNNILFEKINYT